MSKLGAVIIVALSLSSSRAGALPLTGTPNPDPARITVLRDRTIEVRACGDSAVVEHPLADVEPYRSAMLGTAGQTTDATDDVRNVQWAVQNVPARGTVRLRPGPRGEAFDFGASAVWLPGINLVGSGVDPHGNPKTVIVNGIQAVRANYLVPGDRAAVDGLWFRRTRGHSVVVDGGHQEDCRFQRFELSDNKFTEAQPQFFDPEILYTQAFAIAFCTTDEVVLRGNHVDSREAALTNGGDTALEVVSVTYRSLEITDNLLQIQGLGVFVLANRGPDGEMVIERNRVFMNGLGGPPSNAFWVSANEGARVIIAHNQLRLSQFLYAFSLSHLTPGADFVMKDNDVLLDGGLAAINLGLAFSALDNDIPAPLSGARVAGNSFAGHAQRGISAIDDPEEMYIGVLPFDNASSDNLFVKNSFARLTVAGPPDGCRVALGPSTSGTRFVNNDGLELDCDEGSDNR